MLVSVSVARSMGWDGILGCAVSGDLQERRRSSLQRGSKGRRNEGEGMDVYGAIGPNVLLARKMKYWRRVVVERREVRVGV